MANNLDNWGSFTGSNFLKAENVKDENDTFVVINIEESQDDDRSAKPRLTLGHGDLEYTFDLNVTNAKFCADKVKSPRMLIGKKMFFKKVMVLSPATKKEVEGLRIVRIE